MGLFFGLGMDILVGRTLLVCDVPVFSLLVYWIGQ